MFFFWRIWCFFGVLCVLLGVLLVFFGVLALRACFCLAYLLFGLVYLAYLVYFGVLVFVIGIFGLSDVLITKYMHLCRFMFIFSE